MAEASSPVDGLEARRRKVRKGTQSCWECRRRKVRCIFASTADTICNNCQRRGKSCISQEQPPPSNEPSTIPSASGNQVEARLGRVEELIENLTHSPATTHRLDSPHGNLPESISAEPELSPLAGRASDRYTGLQTPTTSEVEAGTVSSFSDCNIVHVLDTSDKSTYPRPSLDRPSAVTGTSPVQGRRTADKYEEVSRALTAAWPCQRDIDNICTLPVGLSAHLLGGICTPYSSLMGRDLPSPQEMLQLPPSGSHPVLIARKLLVLGTFLQAVLPPSTHDPADRGLPYRDVMSRVVETAIRLVTTNEDLICSVEGVECVMIEAMYQNYAGNPHRAWLAVHRAASIAQMMALHRGLHSPSLKILTPETRAAFDSDQICFRLVEMDSYLSLMLGLPRTSLEARFATPKALEGCQPVDRLPRIHCAMADRILRRNENNLSETQEIDMVLQKAADDLPAQWWLMPDVSVSSSDGIKISHDTMRLMYQFSHYHLLTRLHLPYMLRSSTDHRYDHSKITAVNVSRETLARFVAFRTSNPAHFYCRGADFLAFVATTVLCLAYIDSHRQRHDAAQGPSTGTVFNFLAHSRPSDRGMMERTLEIIESMTRTENDTIATKIVRTLRPLLAIETNAASGIRINTNSSKDDEGGELEYHGKLTNDGKGLHVFIPYFGTINFERRAISKSFSAVPPPHEQDFATASVPDMSPFNNEPSERDQEARSAHDYLPSYQTGSQSDDHNVPTMQFRSIHSLPQDNGFSGFSGKAAQDLASFEDDWDMSGVDVALFDSLFRGTGITNGVEGESWEQWMNNG